MNYAIVRADCQHGDWRFSKWHDTEESATEEAMRLCAKEGKEFIVLKNIGVARRKETPVEFLKEAK